MESGGQKGALSCPGTIVAEPTSEKKDFLFLPGKSSDNERLPQPSQEKVTILPTPNPDALQV